MRTKIQNAVIYDGRDGKQEHASILFDETGILEVGAGLEDAEADQTIDGTGLCCMPGWFNSHIHLAMDGLPNMRDQSIQDDTQSKAVITTIRNGLRCLKSGVVSVRDLGAPYDATFVVRNAVNAGQIIGPRIFTSGRAICITGGHGYELGIEADGPDETRKAARLQIKQRADVIKIMATGGDGKPSGNSTPEFSEEEIRPIVEEARKAGIHTAAHAQGKQGVLNCLHAGVDSIEHGVMLDDEQIDLMVKQGTFFCPTLLPPYFVVKYGVEHGISPAAVGRCAEQVECHFEGFKKAYKAGVRIIAGNDAGTSYNYQHDITTEFRMMVQLGMTVRDVITSATYNPALCLSMQDKLGSLEKGKYADLTVVEGDPEQDLDAFDRVRFVFKGGKKLYCRENGADWFASAT